MQIIERVNKVSEKYNVSMVQIALWWLFKKDVDAPIVGAAKVPHFDDAVRSVDLELDDENVRYLDELCEPHRIVGANKKQWRLDRSAFFDERFRYDEFLLNKEGI